MSWKCAVCGAVDGRDKAVVNAVCHHCGKPLCDKHQIVVRDSAFGHEDDDPPVWAIHCKDCGHRYHKVAPRTRRERKS